MKLRFWRFDLQLVHRWTIASHLPPHGHGGKAVSPALFVELRDRDGLCGIGEVAPSTRYQEDAETAANFLEHVNPYQLAFTDLEGSGRYLRSIAPGNFAAQAALNIALLDGAARLAGKPVHEFLGFAFEEARHITSISIGLASPDEVRRKTQEAEPYPLLKLKLGGPNDRESLQALRDVAPDKPVRVDANEAWATKEAALTALEWLATDGRIQFVEQPMPADTDLADLAWLKQRSPLPLFADESYRYAGDLTRCVEAFHGVNVKLAKAGGVLLARDALVAARSAGLQTMLGCMIESSLLVTAAAHLAVLADHLDLDGPLLITNNPFRGVTTEHGVVSFATAPAPTGLRVTARDS